MDVEKIKRICERGMEYNREVKYRLKDDGDSSQELEFPHRLPLKKKNSQKHTMSDQDFKFAKEFKDKSIGRMNWKMCLQVGLLAKYACSESLRVSFSGVYRQKYKKKKLYESYYTETFLKRQILVICNSVPMIFIEGIVGCFLRKGQKRR